MPRTLPLFLLLACGGTTADTGNTTPITGGPGTTTSVDPMVGEWAGTAFTVDGDTTTLPATEYDGSVTELEVSFTAEPRGLLTWVYTDTGGVESTETYEFVIDVFDTGRWLVEIEDGGSDMIQDCSADATTLQCSGSCDGSPGCTLDFVRK